MRRRFGMISCGQGDNDGEARLLRSTRRQPPSGQWRAQERLPQAGKKVHPDANPGDSTAESKFKEVSEAYEALKDPQRRAAYDQFGHAAFEQGGMGAGQGFGPDFSSSFHVGYL